MYNTYFLECNNSSNDREKHNYESVNKYFESSISILLIRFIIDIFVWKKRRKCSKVIISRGNRVWSIWQFTKYYNVFHLKSHLEIEYTTDFVTLWLKMWQGNKVSEVQLSWHAKNITKGELQTDTPTPSNSLVNYWDFQIKWLIYLVGFCKTLIRGIFIALISIIFIGWLGHMLITWLIIFPPGLTSIVVQGIDRTASHKEKWLNLKLTSVKEWIKKTEIWMTIKWKGKTKKTRAIWIFKIFEPLFPLFWILEAKNFIGQFEKSNFAPYGKKG